MIVKVGATPVFVDCDLVTRNIDLAQVEAAITPRTQGDHADALGRARSSTWTRSTRSRGRHGLRVIEDAALVMGSQWQGRNVGAIGDLVTFSFHPNKNITTIEGGALVVNDAAEAQRVERAALPRHHATCPTARATSRSRAASSTCPTSTRAIGVAQLAQLPEFLAHAARAGRALLRALRDRPAVRAAAARRATATASRGTCSRVLLPLAADDDHAPAVSRRARGARASAPAYRTRRSTCHARPPLRLPATAISRRPSASRAKRVTLPLHPAMTRRRRRPRLRRGRRRSSRARRSLTSRRRTPWRHRTSRS